MQYRHAHIHISRCYFERPNKYLHIYLLQAIWLQCLSLYTPDILLIASVREKFDRHMKLFRVLHIDILASHRLKLIGDVKLLARKTGQAGIKTSQGHKRRVKGTILKFHCAAVKGIWEKMIRSNGEIMESLRFIEASNSKTVIERRRTKTYIFWLMWPEISCKRLLKVNSKMCRLQRERIERCEVIVVIRMERQQAGIEATMQK